MMYSFRPQGVCAREMHVGVNDQGVIENLEVVGGCSGNLQGISSLVKGLPVDEVINRLSGIRCGAKSTSCPAQIAEALKQFKEKNV